jgi:hypothetical protein
METDKTPNPKPTYDKKAAAAYDRLAPLAKPEPVQPWEKQLDADLRAGKVESYTLTDGEMVRVKPTT